MSSRVSFTLAKPLVACPKDTSTTITIPPGSVVEVLNPAVGDLVDIHCEGEVHSVSLNNLIGACRDDARDRRGLA